MDLHWAWFVLFAAAWYFGEVETQGMNVTVDHITADEFNMTTPQFYMNTTEIMNGTEFNTTTTELYTANTTELNMNVTDFSTNTTDAAVGVKGDNMFQDGEKNLMVALAIVIAINCVGAVVFVVWIVRKCLRDNARKTAAKFYKYENQGFADDISVDTSSKRKLSTIAESDHDSVTMESTAKAPPEVQAGSDDHSQVMELSRLSSVSTRAHGSESENV